MRGKPLPAPSGVGWRLLHTTPKGAISSASLEECLRSDAALCAHVVRLVNAGLGSDQEPVATFEEAIDREGAHTVRDLCLALCLLDGHRQGPCQGYDYDAHWSVGLRTAVAAHHLALRSRQADPIQAFTFGLLADLGRVALASVHAPEYARLWPELRELDEHARRIRERAAFGLDSCELGVALLDHWGFEPEGAEALALPPGAARNERGLGVILDAAGRMSSLLQGGSAAEAADASRVAASAGASAEELTGILEDVRVACSEWGGRLDVPLGAPTTGDSLSGTGFFVFDPQETEPGASSGPSGLRVLAVDDDPVSLRVLSRHLTRAGHSVALARNGRQALQMTLNDPPQLIVTDWMMPELDGIEFCRALRKTAIGRGIYVLILTSREDEEKIVEAFDAGADDYVVKLSGSPDGAIFNARILLARVRAGQRMIELREQVEREKRRLRAAALTDALTRLPNRRYAMRRLEQEAARSRRSGACLSVMMLDIDHFKAVNDQHGHDVGDHVLCQTACVLREATRQNDVVCRLGGEEFLVICGGSDLARAASSAERLRASIEAHQMRLGQELSNVTVSIGVAELRGDKESVDDLLKRADLQVYAAKNGGRNRVCAEPPDRRAAS